MGAILEVIFDMIIPKLEQTLFGTALICII